MSAKSRDPNRLPQGAEAALWSIVESLPDPRNHLALTRDETAQVTVSRHEVAAADRLAAQPVAQAEPVDHVESGAPAEPAEPVDRREAERPDMPAPRHDGVRWSADTAEVRLPVYSRDWAKGA